MCLDMAKMKVHGMDHAENWIQTFDCNKHSRKTRMRSEFAFYDDATHKATTKDL